MRLDVAVAGVTFQNPVLLAAGTAGFGRQLDGVVGLDALGGIVTKAVSLHPRGGNAAPRVAETAAGMLNAVGLANPGVEAVRGRELPWLAAHLRAARVVVNVVGDAVEDFARVIERVDDQGVVAAYELNVSCPNVERGGAEFGADPQTLAAVVRGARAATARPLLVKLSPALRDVADAAVAAVEAGADAITVVNTLPGLAIDVETRRPRIGFGTGGVSGAGLLPVGVLAAYRVARAVRVPVIGVGGVASATDALQYILAGASLVAIGTGALRDPRLPERVVRELARWGRRHGVGAVTDLVGAVEWAA